MTPTFAVGVYLRVPYVFKNKQWSVKFEVLTATSMKIAVFWYVKRCSLIALKIEAVSTSETSINVYHATRRKNPEDSCLSYINLWHGSNKVSSAHFWNTLSKRVSSSLRMSTTFHNCTKLRVKLQLYLSTSSDSRREHATFWTEWWREVFRNAPLAS
jgi:hypothetical protein